MYVTTDKNTKIIKKWNNHQKSMSASDKKHWSKTVYTAYRIILNIKLKYYIIYNKYKLEINKAKIKKSVNTQK